MFEEQVYFIAAAVKELLGAAKTRRMVSTGSGY
jgi:hypothetical protein